MKRAKKILNDNSPMPFGLFKGDKMTNVPARLLLHYYDQEWITEWPEVNRYVEENRDVLLEEVKAEQTKRGSHEKWKDLSRRR